MILLSNAKFSQLRRITVIIMLHGRCNFQSSTGKLDGYRHNLSVVDFNIGVNHKPSKDSLIAKDVSRHSSTHLFKSH